MTIPGEVNGLALVFVVAGTTITLIRSYCCLKQLVSSKGVRETHQYM